MITVTLKDILNSKTTFQKIGSTNMKITSAYKIARLLREIEKEKEFFENIRKKIIYKYCQRNEDGTVKMSDGNIVLQPSQIENFNQEMNELMNTSINLNAEKITIEDIESPELTPAQIADIFPFLQ